MPTLKNPKSSDSGNLTVVDYEVAILKETITPAMIQELEDSLMIHRIHSTQRVFHTPQDMADHFNMYFRYCGLTGRHPTLTGLALVCDVGRDLFYQMERNRPEFKNIIRKARAICEEYAVQQLFRPGGVSIGSIFYLKNMGWSDVKVEKHEDKRSITSITIYNQDEKNPKVIELTEKKTGKIRE